jgi:hypothetical protein
MPEQNDVPDYQQPKMIISRRLHDAYCRLRDHMADEIEEEYGSGSYERMEIVRIEHAIIELMHRIGS